MAHPEVGITDQTALVVRLAPAQLCHEALCSEPLACPGSKARHRLSPAMSMVHPRHTLHGEHCAGQQLLRAHVEDRMESSVQAMTSPACHRYLLPSAEKEARQQLGMLLGRASRQVDHASCCVAHWVLRSPQQAAEGTAVRHLAAGAICGFA